MVSHIVGAWKVGIVYCLLQVLCGKYRVVLNTIVRWMKMGCPTVGETIGKDKVLHQNSLFYRLHPVVLIHAGLHWTEVLAVGVTINLVNQALHLGVLYT